MRLYAFLNLSARDRDDLFHRGLEARPRFRAFHVFRLGRHSSTLVPFMLESNIWPRRTVDAGLSKFPKIALVPSCYPSEILAAGLLEMFNSQRDIVHFVFERPLCGICY